MKSFFVVAASVAIATVSAVDCDLPKLLPLLQDPNVKACTAETSWQPPIPPTDAQYPAVCVASCKAALGSLEALGLGDCTIRTFTLVTGLINPVKTKCGWSGAATVPSSAPTAPTTAPTKAPTQGTPTAQGTSAPTPVVSAKPPPPPIKMKSFFVIAVAAMVAVASAEPCDVSKLIPLLSDPDVKQCGAETGLAPPTPPKADILPKVCANSFCNASRAKLRALNVGDCTIGAVALETDFLKPIEKFCAAATSAPSSAPSSAPTTAPTKVPAPGTPTAPSTAPTPSVSPKPVC
ncbi:hypothetical protein PybrP1_010450 [[Pythium] brassicae (nom. inval.)]|nr:hypothetical protein PybrP1_010450 [[Pythium] brassicae (nom. inval.)]